jgi:hypothetical protein
LEAASIPAAHPLESARPFAESVTNRLALGIAAGLIAVLVHGEAAAARERGAHVARPARPLSA